MKGMAVRAEDAGAVIPFVISEAPYQKKGRLIGQKICPV